MESQTDSRYDETAKNTPENLMGSPEKPLAFWGEGGARKQAEVFLEKEKQSKANFALTRGVSNFDTHKQGKGILIRDKNDAFLMM